MITTNNISSNKTQQYGQNEKKNTISVGMLALFSNSFSTVSVPHIFFFLFCCCTSCFRIQFTRELFVFLFFFTFLRLSSAPKKLRVFFSFSFKVYYNYFCFFLSFTLLLVEVSFAKDLFAETTTTTIDHRPPLVNTLDRCLVLILMSHQIVFIFVTCFIVRVASTKNIFLLIF